MNQPIQPRVDLIWNKGLASLCDRRIPDEFPDGFSYTPVPSFAGALTTSRLPSDLIADPARYRDIREGELIWVRLSWLRSFVAQVLPYIRSSFVLVTGDSDSCVPSESLPEGRAILQSSKVIHWHTQNYDATLGMDKISPLPIGIDFHTVAERQMWGESITSPLKQERSMTLLREQLPRTADRIRKVYLDFAWQRALGLRSYRLFHPLKGTTFRENRRRVTGKLRRNEVVFSQTERLSRSDMWRKRGEYAFVLSPHGVGLDCHRTWEALALGHIVLVPSSSLDGLYTGLPVIPLKSWQEITAPNLDRWISQFPHPQVQHEKLTNRYWIAKMRSMVCGTSTPGPL